MNMAERFFPRRDLFKTLGAAAGAVTIGRWLDPTAVVAQEPVQAKAMETFTGPGPNSHWNSVGPYVVEPQKVPLILL
ncbi:MAG TPA: hypothetical protein VNB49_07250, partial [Candidatus Dormibacteraeota bacterium]|nr:hypothetical protein [Candidatus Dormibacteraeota bacterium]